MRKRLIKIIEDTCWGAIVGAFIVFIISTFVFLLTFSVRDSFVYFAPIIINFAALGAFIGFFKGLIGDLK